MKNPIKIVTPGIDGGEGMPVCTWKRLAGARLALVLFSMVGLSSAAWSQALPAAEASPASTGFSLPTTSGTLQYAVSASQSLTWGYYGSGVATSTNLTGDLAYLSSSSRNPFSVVAAGGRSWGNLGQPSYNFVSLALSQVINVGRWEFLLSDNTDYLPSTPTTGISGIPGLGDLGLTPVQAGIPSAPQGVLSDFADRVDETGSLSIQRQITGKTSANASGSYTISRYVGNASLGIDSDSASGSIGMMHQYSVRNGLGGNYAYSSYKFVGYLFGIPAADFVSQTASAIYTHSFTRRLMGTASVGPQWTTIDYLGKTTSLGLFADVSASYTGKESSQSFSFVRGTNSGYGVIGGSISDGLNYTATKTFSRVLTGAFTASYTHSASLPTPGLPTYRFDTTLLGVQVSRALGRSLSCYGSYTFEDQSNQGSALTAINVFSGRANILGFGITYAPMALHVGHP